MSKKGRGEEPAGGGTGLARRARARRARSFREEERRGNRLALRGRSVALGAISALLFYLNPFPEVLYYQGLLAVFLLLGFLNFAVQARYPGQRWPGYLFVAADFALLAFTLIVPNPLVELPFTPQLGLRYGNFIYFFVVLAGLALIFRPLLVVWGGVVGAISWLAGVAWVVSQPGTITEMLHDGGRDALVATLLQPAFVDLNVRVQEVAVFVIVAGLLALAVLRSQRLVERQAALERERTNLARYFPPAIVDRLAAKQEPLSQVRVQPAAVLFADIVGFTAWSEKHQPPDVIALLREVHAQLESIVFANHGTLDKFIGDGLMATFGTPETGPEDAVRAVACVVAIVHTFTEWNQARAERGLEPIRISVGLHFGPVVVGDIGTDRRLEFAVLGDTVNVASRLENLTRELDCLAVVSGAAIEAARRAGATIEGLTLFSERGALAVKGRNEPVPVWTIG